ncbi:conserved hypothetical protein [Hyella patelloides LEGE 07179]|uniref:Uncharacterized protein n=1 Tax=Hyella patelloides LEGE 07179 TaxID=945734 RepID=A0A563W4B3_9CYAN|nr:hypothetical protein [Hyella patelloides]VEP18539.1 conserved hypothetical protein [Hyella patelloides LEGE 07179]
MTITLKHYADYFAIALEIGLPIKEEIITWADNLILNNSKPSMWAIDLATSHNKSIQDTIGLLREVPEESDLNISFKLIIAKISILYNFVKEEDYPILSSLGNWYRVNHAKIKLDLHFMSAFEVMYNEPRYIWQYFFDESEIPEYYQELIVIGKDYIQYLPI